MGVGPNQVSQWRLLQVQAGAEAGLSSREIGETIGVHPRTVQQWMTRYGIKSQWRPPASPHGTASRYSHGCRCDPCSAAHSIEHAATMRRLNDETRPGAVRGKEPWQAWEDDIVRDRTIPIKEICARIGRTYTAVQLRRGRLAQLDAQS